MVFYLIMAQQDINAGMDDWWWGFTSLLHKECLMDGKPVSNDMKMMETIWTDCGLTTQFIYQQAMPQKKNRMRR